MKLEVIVIPVSDVDRAKRFYGGLGWRLDIDYGRRRLPGGPVHAARLRMLGHLRQERYSGGARLDAGLHLIVSDIGAACDELLGRGIEVSEPFHDAGGIFHHASPKGLVSGPNPQRKSYASYASFSDPDGNGWVFQEVTARLTGHIEPGDTSFTPELTNGVRRAEVIKHP